MTTIAYRGGVMAADSMAYLGSREAKHARKTKLRKLPDGSVAGASSSEVGLTSALLDWVEQGCSPDNRPSSDGSGFELLVVKPNACGAVELYNDSFYPTKAYADFTAIGSGSAYALGAMAMGADAHMAVRVAGQFDHFTGGDTTVMDVG